MATKRRQAEPRGGTGLDPDAGGSNPFSNGNGRGSDPDDGWNDIDKVEQQSLIPSKSSPSKPKPGAKGGKKGGTSSIKTMLLGFLAPLVVYGVVVFLRETESLAHPSCSKHDGEGKVCKNTPGCKWLKSEKQCIDLEELEDDAGDDSVNVRDGDMITLSNSEVIVEFDGNCAAMTDKKQCKAITECKWIGKEKACFDKQETETDDTGEDPMEDLEDGEMVEVVEFDGSCSSLNDQKKACKQSDDCEWMKKEKECVSKTELDTDDSPGDEGEADAEDIVVFDGDCTHLTTKADCKSVKKQCKWMKKENQCLSKSEIIAAEEEAPLPDDEKKDVIEFDGECSEVSGKKACKAVKECKWLKDESQCVSKEEVNAEDDDKVDTSDIVVYEGSCKPITVKSQCKAIKECNWVGKENACFDREEIEETDDATGDDAATDDEAAMDFDGNCKALTEKQDCKAVKKQCKWMKKENECIPKEDLINDDDTPIDTDIKVIEIDGVQDCHTLEEKKECKAANGCKWLKQENECISKEELKDRDDVVPDDVVVFDGNCQDLDAKTDCKSVKECKWVGKENKCYSTEELDNDDGVLPEDEVKQVVEFSGDCSKLEGKSDCKEMKKVCKWLKKENQCIDKAEIAEAEEEEELSGNAFEEDEPIILFDGNCHSLKGKAECKTVKKTCKWMNKENTCIFKSELNDDDGAYMEGEEGILVFKGNCHVLKTKQECKAEKNICAWLKKENECINKAELTEG